MTTHPWHHTRSARSAAWDAGCHTPTYSLGCCSLGCAHTERARWGCARDCKEEATVALQAPWPSAGGARRRTLDRQRERAGERDELAACPEAAGGSSEGGESINNERFCGGRAEESRRLKYARRRQRFESVLAGGSTCRRCGCLSSPAQDGGATRGARESSKRVRQRHESGTCVGRAGEASGMLWQ